MLDVDDDVVPFFTNDSSIYLLALLVSLHLYLQRPDVPSCHIMFNASVALNLLALSRADRIQGMLPTVQQRYFLLFKTRRFTDDSATFFRWDILNWEQ
jgi:hypothetical protein